MAGDNGRASYGSRCLKIRWYQYSIFSLALDNFSTVKYDHAGIIGSRLFVPAYQGKLQQGMGNRNYDCFIHIDACLCF
ncbi:hypothetical protein CMETHOX_37870 [Lacrimispora indolis]|nr:hypothetical protein CMETHOX_37870 [[Clostridium] methoxybenzovorans]